MAPGLLAAAKFSLQHPLHLSSRSEAAEIALLLMGMGSRSHLLFAISRGELRLEGSQLVLGLAEKECTTAALVVCKQMQPAPAECHGELQ